MNVDPGELLSGLDAQQRSVATTFGRPVVVIAGAGTGKTRSITHRIAYACATAHYQPNAVLAVTFTTRAAGELRTRLRQLGVPAVQARTFHSAALRQAQYFWPQAHGQQLPEVSEDRLGILASAARRLRLNPDPAMLRDLLTEVSWAKVTNVTPADYPELALAGAREVSGLAPEQVAQVLGRYEQVKNEHQVIDFDDILLCATALLSDFPEIGDRVRQTYRHLVVDEYQDVNPLQQTLLDLWWGEGTDHCVVGDPAQTIHSFAGADPRFLTGFLGRHRDAEVIKLVRDYRSTPQVVAWANQLARRSALGTVTLESQREPGPQPQVLVADDEAGEAALVASWLQRQHDQGVPWRQQAVLYRIHAQSPLFEAALSRSGIPFTIRGGEGFYDRGEVRQVLNALAAQAAKTPDAGAVAATEQVLRTLGWQPEPPPGAGRVRERWESLTAVLSLAEDLRESRDSARLAGFVAELQQRQDAEHPLSLDGVTLSTLHAAKGLEWSSVAVIGAQEGTLPLSLAAGPAQLAEEARLFYVGITRAERNLLVTWSRSRRGGGARRGSRFLDGLGAATTAVGAPATVRARRRSALAVTCRVCGRPLEQGAEQKLGRHRDCPSDHDQAVFGALVAWRAELARERSQPAFVIFTDATLMVIAERLPTSVSELLAIPGVGKVKLDLYGAQVLQLIAEHRGGVQLA